MAISDNAGIPISIYITSTASPQHEVTTLAEATVSTKCFVYNEKPERIIGEDKAYDSDPLDEKLAIEYGVELIAPHRYNRQGTQYARWPAIASLQTPVEDRKSVCMVAEFPSQSIQI